ncbi:MAG: dihydroneopterin aldolase [Bacteroidetes bacterium]|nr:dihydroneopterin aldolase [Bacteroidota bacterium]
MGVIYVNDIEVYAQHGCLEEEAVIGGKYIIDAVFHVDVKKAAHHDDLDLTIDYVKVTEIVQREMAIRAKLIESVGYRILHALENEFPQAEAIRVKLTKIAPPIPGQVGSVSIELRTHHG